MLWNAIDSSYEAPHVYVISSIDVIYIGETQKIPVVRWGQHLEAGGDFRKRLAEKGDPERDYLSQVLLFARRCDWIIDRFTPAQWRVATQAVEHSLHEFLTADPRCLGAHLRVISDTEKTAPRGFRSWDMVHCYAREVVSELQAVMAYRTT